YKEAIACYERALDMTKRIQDSTRVAICYQSLGDVHMSSDSIPKAIECYINALHIAEETDNQRGVATACTYLCNAYSFAGNDIEAVKWGRRAIELGEQLHDDRRIAFACIMSSKAYGKLGEFDEMGTLIQRAIHLCEKTGDFHGMAWAKNMRAMFHFWHQDYESALEELNYMIQMGKESGGFQHEVTQALAHFAEIHLRLGRYREAFEYCQQSLEISLRLSNMVTYGHAYRVLAEIHTSEEYRDWEKASWYLEESLKAYREVGSQANLGLAYLIGARIALQRKDGTARQWAETARNIFSELGAKLYLQDAEEFLESLE
ncbi:tetratricopeptide repeat protein, partial [Thermodesulfobacteriota bacterium]